LRFLPVRYIQHFLENSFFAESPLLDFEVFFCGFFSHNLINQIFSLVMHNIARVKIKTLFVWLMVAAVISRQAFAVKLYNVWHTKKPPV